MSAEFGRVGLFAGPVAPLEAPIRETALDRMHADRTERNLMILGSVVAVTGAVLSLSPLGEAVTNIGQSIIDALSDGNHSELPLPTPSIDINFAT